MIIDGKEVIYSMKDRKLVYPEIPTEGLVCYLDARGKYNTDIYRNTLLDLSGNGNHRTLRNFNFTEESGYVKDLSGGSASGLKFDGVDDFISGLLYANFSTHAFTYMIEFAIDKTAKEQNKKVDLGMRFYIHPYDNSIYCYHTTNDYGTVYPRDVNIAVGKHKVIIAYSKDFTDAEYFVDGIRYTAVNTTDAEGVPHTYKEATLGMFGIDKVGEKIIYKQAVWDRRLSELEITQLMEV